MVLPGNIYTIQEQMKYRAKIDDLEYGMVLCYFDEDHTDFNGETIVLLGKPSFWEPPHQQPFQHLDQPSKRRVDLEGIFLDGSVKKFWTWEQDGFLLYWCYE